jgi:acetolactate synthase I/III small subunit
MTLHTLGILVEDRPGVLSRITGLFSRRGYNIESLAVGRCETAGMSRITVTATGNDAELEQVRKQLDKLIDVIRVSDLTATERVERELALIRVATSSALVRAEILQIALVFRASVVDAGGKSVILEVTGDEGKINALEKILHRYGVKECVRTGRIALPRDTKKQNGQAG